MREEILFENVNRNTKYVCLPMVQTAFCKLVRKILLGTLKATYEEVHL